ncbi:HNH endonuclease [Methylomonas sp. DH-1]|uniref:HNH endonuclease n=1 Tax=Methylomonas sp. (strain DH-1) TaxID=1727196 RepID=UPI0007C96046|nr:HNH endonuclease signature motif containing protein [Methylomonas sp. DH-1]ANE54266.1 hypothetical protein AYM39_03070 [Methylomonas sp. DH-1]
MEYSDTNNKTLIDKYQEDYKAAIKSIDWEVKELIQNGKEMKGILLFSQSINSILEVHSSLHTFYSAIYNHQDVLKKFNSERLKQLGHDPKPTFELLKDANASQDDIEKYVERELATVGFNSTHWYIKGRILSEIEYMIEALKILIEPEFIPFEDNVEESQTENQTDRYVPSNVKLAVWRRDSGKCVECGSNEKLEYDHIIPISKGGSNTERNVQLLCEKCNRKKSANIQ